MNRAIARHREEVDDDLRPAMPELRARHPSLVAHPESLHDAFGRLVGGVDDRHDARTRAQAVLHRGAAPFGRVTEAPPVARQPPADLVIARRAERLDPQDADYARRRL